ncbi:hypothetical protein EWM64_g1252 [Hericium alpestre]|uniref:Uncharacterized protein n=1 Tax=Hericium alpestre TaxID=135208 RepID=A0A4Z0A9Z5_9AGAM|nr:hypothetical protein EWM64_g1252 [Hericium alpestre]
MLNIGSESCVYDSRAVLHMADMAGAQDAQADVTPYILDFNLIRHQRPMLDSEAHDDTASNGNWTLIDESTSISVPEYEEPIITSLPYYIAPAPGSEQHTRYCIDDERIVGITQSNMAGEVTVYSF